jgi:cation diffusion facilitator family transporter
MASLKTDKLPDPEPGMKTVMVGSLPDRSDVIVARSLVKSSTEGSSVRSALIANIVVTAAKFICGFAGVQSMMSEAIHSLADSMNEIILLWGKRESHRPPTKLHPLGGSRMRYFSGLIVSLLLFGVGGLFTVIEASGKVSTITSGGPDAHTIDSRALIASIIVAGIASFAETWSLHNSYREARAVHKMTNDDDHFNMLRFWLDTKSSDLTSVIAEDVLAIIGLIIAIIGCVASLVTGDEIWDAFSSLLIGCVLIAGAIELGRHNGSLLLGEGASQAVYDKIVSIIDDDDTVIAVLRPIITTHLSEKRIEVKTKLQFRDDVDIVTEINRLEDQIRSAFDHVYSIDLWIEPDRYDADRARQIEQYVD